MATDSGNDPYRPYRRVGLVLAALVVAAALAEFAWNFQSPSDRDFLSFWGAGRLALAGTPELAYDGNALHAVQLTAAPLGAGELPFAYAPALLMLFAPFALLPFPTSMALWSALGFGIYLIVARRALRVPAWVPAAFPPAYANAAIGQNGFLTAALFMGGLALLSSAPLAAGMVLGCLIVKPQLALMLPVALIAGRQWRAIAGGAISSAAILLAGLILFGPGATTAWLDQMQLFAAIARDGLVGWHKLTSVYAFARAVGLSAPLAFAAHSLVAAAAAIAVWRIWRSDAEAMAKAAVLAAATLLASPYLYIYDWLLLLPAFHWLVERRTSPAVIALLWCLPIAIIAEVAVGSGSPNIGAAVPIALLWLVYRQWRADRPRGGIHRGSPAGAAL